MCELLILGKFSNKFTHHLSQKEKSDELIEIKKLVSSFEGEYILRKGVSSSKFHGVAVIKFKDENAANSFIDACHISDYLSETQIYKLCEVKILENRFKNIFKKIKVTEGTINT